MSDGDSYVEVPAATQEVIAEEDHDHPTESFKTDTLGRQEAPAAPNMSASTLVGPFLLLMA
jgi:hypothetical protein